jgi:thymidylate kinase
MFWVDLGYALVPKPDIVLLLDAPPGVLRTRKQEVSFEEATRQCAAYRELVEVLPSGVMIKADQPLEDVVNDALRIILNYLVRRTNRQWKRR